MNSLLIFHPSFPSMEIERKTCTWMLWISCLCYFSCWPYWVSGKPQVPCFFIFGDSLVDNGNNNFLATNAKSNYWPYGIDFPRGPTGRFTNGRTTADIIAELLGFEDYIPPNTKVRGEDILNGVNYASGGGGIREETSYQLGGRTSFARQVYKFTETVEHLVNLRNSKGSAAGYLSQCIYLIVVGSNDCINNYFMPLYYRTSRLYTPQEYADNLVQQYSLQLKTLYKYGARKVVLAGIGQVGCSPYAITQYSPTGTRCIQRMNAAVQIFNQNLKALVDEFNKLPDAHFIYGDSYGVFQDLVDLAEDFGFWETNTACCGIGKNKSQLTCLPLEKPCRNRTEYIFWDAFHPTDAANIILGKRLYSAQKPSDAYPTDIQHLAQL